METILKNINWTVNKDMINLQALTETNYFDTLENVMFEYNGYKLDVTLNIDLDLAQLEEEEVGYKETVLVGVTIDITNIYYEDGEEAEFMAKEIIAFENELIIDFKIQY